MLSVGVSDCESSFVSAPQSEDNGPERMLQFQIEFFCKTMWLQYWQYSSWIFSVRPVVHAVVTCTTDTPGEPL